MVPYRSERAVRKTTPPETRCPWRPAPAPAVVLGHGSKCRNTWPCQIAHRNRCRKWKALLSASHWIPVHRRGCTSGTCNVQRHKYQARWQFHDAVLVYKAWLHVTFPQTDSSQGSEVTSSMDMHSTDWSGFGNTASCNRQRCCFRQRSEAISQTKVSHPEHRDPLSHINVRRRTVVCAVECNS